jgi:hypothetical protein
MPGMPPPGPPGPPGPGIPPPAGPPGAGPSGATATPPPGLLLAIKSVICGTNVPNKAMMATINAIVPTCFSVKFDVLIFLLAGGLILISKIIYISMKQGFL